MAASRRSDTFWLQSSYAQFQGLALIELDEFNGSLGNALTQGAD